MEESKLLAQILSIGLNCSVTDRLEDTVHTKLIVNQANALMTIVGYKQRQIESFKILIKLTLLLFWEGIQIVKGCGFS